MVRIGMFARIARGFDSWIDHYAAACVFLAQFILTFLGIGEVRTISLLGLLLCAAGLLQRSARVDWWVLVPLLLYSLAGMASSWAAYGNITDGYGALHLIFPVLCLLISCLDSDERRWLRRLCGAWAGVVAALGVGTFVVQAAVQNRAGRLGGLLGNPNALGAFLVVGWFLILACQEETSFLVRLEPLVLTALALTLSMGSFVAMAAGTLVLLLDRWRTSGGRAALGYACRLLAKAGLGVGTGLLLYLSAARTGVPWSCLAVAAYALALVACWPELERFLERFPKIAAGMTLCGGGVALAAVALRPSSIATFAERLDMMASAAGYLTRNPLLGVGPFQWRLLDLYDGGIYFNTWHIHNVPLHIAVELGWPAAVLLVLAAARLFWKKTPAVRAGLTAFCVHNLMDTSFFYLGITSLALIAAEASGTEGRKAEGATLKLLFGGLAAVYAVHLVHALLAG